MIHYLKSGVPVRLSAPAIAAAANFGLKSLLNTVNAGFAALPDLPIITRGSGLANILSELAVGSKVTLKSIEADIKSEQSKIFAECKIAKDLVSAADNYAACLRSCSKHILTGSAIRFKTFAPEAVQAAEILRASYLLGDLDGLAAKTANILEKECDNAAEILATASDHSVRKMNSVIRLSVLNATAKKFRALSSQTEKSATLATDDDRKRAEMLAKNNEQNADIYHRAYQDAYLNEIKTRRIPQLNCIDSRRLKRVGKGYKVTNGVK